MRKQLFHIALMTALAASSLAADTTLEFSETRFMSNSVMGERTDTSTHTVTIGEDHSRFDFYATSFIYDASSQRGWMIFHKSKTYMTFDMPIVPDDLVAENERATLAKFRQLGAAAVEIEATNEQRTIGGWQAQRWHVEAVSAISGNASRVDAWLTREIPVDEALFEGALALFETFHPGKAWIDVLREQDGIPVQIEERRSGGTLKSTTTVLESVTPNVEVPGDHYAIPAGYAEVPFQLSWFASVGG